MEPVGPDPRVSSDQVRVVVADADPLARHGIISLLVSGSRVEVVGECATGSRAVQQVVAHRPSVLILDLHLPSPNGLETAGAARRAHPTLRVILLSKSVSPELTQRAKKLGVEATLSRHEAVVELRNLLVPSGVPVETFTDSLLSTRELAVTEMIALGLTNAEIGSRLGLGAETIKTYASRIYRKLGVRNRTELSRLWRER